MYRIELSPGEETVFRSIEELAVAVKRGVVTPRARIFHSASNKWLPIQFHPHYKAAVSMPLTQAALIAGPQVKPLSTLSLQPRAEPEPPLPMPVPAAVAVAAAGPLLGKTREEKRVKENGSRRRSKPRRQLRIALVGALLVGGAQWVLSAPLFSRTNAPYLLEAHRNLIAGPAAAMKQISLPNTAAMVPVLRPSSPSRPPAVPQGASGPRGRVSAPSFGGTSAVDTATASIVEPPPALELDPPTPTVDLLDSTTHPASKKTSPTPKR